MSIGSEKVHTCAITGDFPENAFSNRIIVEDRRFCRFTATERRPETGTAGMLQYRYAGIRSESR